MTRDHYRSIGALVGLAAGFAVMVALGQRGLTPAALFGAGGCVAGGVTGEKIHAWVNRTGSKGN